MAQVIEKIVRSKYPPRDTRVLWLDENENTIKSFITDGWKPTEGSGNSSAACPTLEFTAAPEDDYQSYAITQTEQQKSKNIPIYKDIIDGKVSHVHINVITDFGGEVWPIEFVNALLSKLDGSIAFSSGTILFSHIVTIEIGIASELEGFDVLMGGMTIRSI